MGEPKYLLCPDWVDSAVDGQRHFVSAVQLAQLYGVPPSECIIYQKGLRFNMCQYIILRPRRDGNYKTKHLQEQICQMK